jgi:hypothetical protein
MTTRASHLAHDLGEFLREGGVVDRIVDGAFDDHEAALRKGLATFYLVSVGYRSGKNHPAA